MPWCIAAGCMLSHTCACIPCSGSSVRQACICPIADAVQFCPILALCSCRCFLCYLNALITFRSLYVNHACSTNKCKCKTYRVSQEKRPFAVFHPNFRNHLEFWGQNFYGSPAIPYMHVVQFYPWNFCFQILIKFLVVSVGSFMNDLFSTNKLTLKAAGKTTC